MPQESITYRYISFQRTDKNPSFINNNEKINIPNNNQGPKVMEIMQKISVNNPLDQYKVCVSYIYKHT